MLCRVRAAVALLALLCGSWTAPYTHGHGAIDSMRDEHHPQGESLVHTHTTPHAHHHPEDPEPEPVSHEDGDERVWSVDSFVFPQPFLGHAPAPGLLVVGALRIALTRVWLSADRPQPTAHGPPITSFSSLRAPPASLPRFS